MNIAFDGIGEVVATFIAQEGVKQGDVVAVTGDSTVGTCGAGVSFCGVALEPKDGAAAVQVGGFMTVACGSGCPSLGRVTLAGDGNGGVKTATTGVSALVVSTDEAALTAVIYL